MHTTHILAFSHITHVLTIHTPPCWFDLPVDWLQESSAHLPGTRTHFEPRGVAGNKRKAAEHLDQAPSLRVKSAKFANAVKVARKDEQDTTAVDASMATAGTDARAMYDWGGSRAA